MTPRNSPYHGLLIVDKPGLDTADGDPRLPTSHDIVQMVRRWSGQRRIGHTGTLDPMASGVLVLCLGLATRLVEYYQGQPKRYLADVILGQATDTYDVTGQVTETAPVPPLNEEQIEAALESFRGEILQRPPAFSAIKQGGESVHRRARRGETVELAPRPVTIYRLELLAFEPPDRLRLQVACSAGTYIRSLAHDLGRALGTVAHLTRLRREAVGPFTLASAHPLEAIQTAAEEGRFAQLLLPLGEGLAMPTLPLDAEATRRLGHGQQVLLPASDTLELNPDAPLARAVDPTGVFVGIVRCLGPAHDGRLWRWKAEKWFARHGAGQ